MKRFFLFLILPIVCYSIAEGQNFKEDMVKMHSAYANVADFYAEINVEVFSGAASKNVDFVKKAVIKKQGNNYLYKVDEVEMLINTKYRVSTFGDRNLMVIQQRDPSEEFSMVDNVVMQNLDSLINGKADIEFIGLVGGSKCYVIREKGDALNVAKIYLDPQTFFLTKLDYTIQSNALSQKGRVVSTFKNVNIQPNFKVGTFSEKQFFYQKDNQFEPAIAYKNFQILNSSDYEF